MKLQIGQLAPNFTLKSHLGREVTLTEFRGKNVVIAFYPLAFTPIWTSQIPSYEAAKAKFSGLNTQVLGISVDHVDCLKAWVETLGGITYPLLSDFWPHGHVAQRYGVFREDDGHSERALFALDKWGIIRYIDVHDIDKQPDNDVLFDVLRRVDPQAAARLAALEGPPPEAKELPKGGIVMYCTSWCPACRRARAWFQARGLKYVEVDIETNPAAMAQVKLWNNGAKSTPAFDIEGIIIKEFNERRLLEALQEKGMVSP